MLSSSGVTPTVHWAERGVYLMDDLGDVSAAGLVENAATNSERAQIVQRAGQTLRILHRHIAAIDPLLLPGRALAAGRLEYCVALWREVAHARDADVVNGARIARRIEEHFEDSTKAWPEQPILWDTNLTNFIARKTGEFGFVDFEEVCLGRTIQDLCPLLCNSTIGLFESAVVEPEIERAYSEDAVARTLGWKGFLRAYEASAMIYHAAQSSYGIYQLLGRMGPKTRTRTRRAGSGLVYHVHRLRTLAEAWLPEFGEQMADVEQILTRALADLKVSGEHGGT
jgi:aminoglycoside phosphotransferase (APT) family kinase protein